MAKRSHHMGMVMGKGEHDEFHKNAPDLSPRQHEALMKRMGISKQQDEEWHRTHLTLGEQRARGLMHVEPSAIGAGFVKRCVKKGWLVQRGSEQSASKEGTREPGARFDIVVEPTQRR